jgi:hypothetical protein
MRHEKQKGCEEGRTDGRTEGPKEVIWIYLQLRLDIIVDGAAGILGRRRCS